jgi:hypothetical protein
VSILTKRRDYLSLILWVKPDQIPELTGREGGKMAPEGGKFYSSKKGILPPSKYVAGQTTLQRRAGIFSNVLPI